MAKDEIVNIIISMIYFYEEEGVKMKYTLDDINRFIKKYKIDWNKEHYNELGTIILYQNKYISIEKFAKDMDLGLENNKLYLVVSSFSDLLNTNDYEQKQAAEILDGEYDWEFGNTYESDIPWSDYDIETLKEIINFCVTKKLSINDDENDCQTFITIKNTKIIKGDIWVKTKFGNKQLSEFIDSDELDDLKSELNIAHCEAQEDADQDEIYQKLKRSAESKFGAWEHKSKTIKRYDEKTKNLKTEEVYELWFDDIFDWDQMKTELISQYKNNGIIDFTASENYGNWISYSREYRDDGFDIDIPDYNYIYGSIDDDVLNDRTRERLQF